MLQRHPICPPIHHKACCSSKTDYCTYVIRAAPLSQTFITYTHNLSSPSRGEVVLFSGDPEWVYRERNHKGNRLEVMTLIRPPRQCLPLKRYRPIINYADRLFAGISAVACSSWSAHIGNRSGDESTLHTRSYRYMRPRHKSSRDSGECCRAGKHSAECSPELRLGPDRCR